MRYVTYTLVADGSSDRALLPVIDWAIQQNSHLRFTQQYAESSVLRAGGLREKVARALEIYPCDLLFVHRDAEQPGQYAARQREIADAVPRNVRVVPMVPIRMTEAWLLIDEAAVRRAANNPNGLSPCVVPPIRSLEGLIDPKETLFQLLRSASGLSARRLRSFHEGRARARVSELIEDFSPLRGLASFLAFEASLVAALQGLDQ